MSVKSLLRWFGLVVLGIASGCSVYDKSLATGPIGTDCTPGAVGCIPANRPGTSSPADADIAAYALTGIFLKQENNDAWRTIGFNLDNAVTSGGAPVASCTSPSGGSVSIDGEAGIDNVFGSILVPQLIGQLFPTLEDDMCCFMQRGRGTLILRISDWNGDPNDSQVTASLLSSVDGTSDAPSTVMWDSTTHGLLRTSNSTRPALPTWTPDTSTFWVSRGDFQLGSEGDYDDVKQRDTAAYMRDGYLVMRLNSTQPVALYFADVGGIRIPLIDGRFVAKIAADGTAIESGVMGGRMSGDGLLEANVSLAANDINNQPDADSRMASCNGFSMIVGGIVEDFADVTASLVDNDPSNECDAMSVGISFTGVRVESLELAGEALCVPKGDCVNYGPGITCPSIYETEDGPMGGPYTTPICWLGGTNNGIPATGGCNATDWNVRYPGQSVGDAGP